MAYCTFIEKPQKYWYASGWKNSSFAFWLFESVEKMRTEWRSYPMIQKSCNRWNEKGIWSF